MSSPLLSSAIATSMTSWEDWGSDVSWNHLFAFAISLLLNVHAAFESIPFKPARDFALSIEVCKPFEKVRLPVQLQARVLGSCLGFSIQHQWFHVCILSQQSAFCGDNTQWLELVIQERYGWPGPTFDQHSSSQEWFWCRGNWLTPLFSHKKHSNQTQTPCLDQRTWQIQRPLLVTYQATEIRFTWKQQGPS